MNNYRSILVGVDFSPASRHALKTAIRLGAKFNIPITALHVMDPALAGEIKAAHGFSHDDLFEHFFKSLEIFMEQADLNPHQVRFELEVGDPFLGIVGSCRRNGSDLLIMGTHGSEHGSNQVGTFAGMCIRKAPADVLLVRENTWPTFDRVLACVDYSATAAKALRAARMVAEADGSTMECFYAFRSVSAMSLEYRGFSPALAQSDSTMMDGWKQELATFVSPIMEATKLDWKATVLECSNVRDAIMEQIRISKTDLVVMGTRGKTDLRSVFMGTTAEKVITRASCSLLAVKPENFVCPVDDLPINLSV
ncbi:universal stress protein [soil metagenome]